MSHVHHWTAIRLKLHDCVSEQVSAAVDKVVKVMDKVLAQLLSFPEEPIPQFQLH